MKSRWLHAPRFHTDHGPEKRVSWLELFYDLIFVAGIIQVGDALSEGVARGEGFWAFIKFAAFFAPLWVAWTGFTFFKNRYTVDDALHRVLVFAHMFAVGAMSIAAPMAMGTDPNPRPYALSFAIAQALTALFHLRAYRGDADSRAYAGLWGIIFAAGAVVWLVAAFLPAPWSYGVMGAGVLVVLGSPLSGRARAQSAQWPIDQEHLSERYGLLTIIVLGESFVKVLSYLAASEHGLDGEYLLKGCFNLLITCSVWWIYFDDVAGAHLKKGAGSWVVWFYGHLPLGIGITGLGVAVKWAIKFELGSVPDKKSDWLLAGMLAFTFFSVALIDSVTERKNAELSDRQRVAARVASGLVLLVIAQVGTTMTSGVFLGVLAAVCVAQVVFDILLSPLTEGDVSGESLAKLALDRRVKQNRDDDTPPPKRRREVSDAVRRGAPSELRRDLYFFFMEGSWLRMIVALVFVYVMINVLFAGLYLLEPGSIGDDARTFGHAFAFSVQTMSTIGYGAMSPQTPYGDLIVTIEAAVGLLGVALATGLMFAKASRPRASVLFSDNILISEMDGERVLNLRLGNARGNEVVQAEVNVAVIRDYMTDEGHHFRKVLDLPLRRSQTPVFTLSWLVMHNLDEDSPLYDVDFDTCEGVFGFVVTMMGHDATYGTTTHARKTYWPEAVLTDRRFVDVMSELDDGRLLIDYAKFHDHTPDTAQNKETPDDV